MRFMIGHLYTCSSLSWSRRRMWSNDWRLSFLSRRRSSENIQLLINEEIYSIKQLRNRIRTQQDAISYSKKLGIYKNLVEDWVRLGEFSKLHGITQEYIDLLKLNGINTIMDLQNQDPNVLYYQCVRTHNRNAPTLGMIKHWIRASKNINHSLIDNKISVSSWLS